MKIKEARQAVGMTQKEVSDLLAIPERTFKGWELGERVPPAYVETMIVEKLQQIANEREAAYWALALPEAVSKGNNR